MRYIFLQRGWEDYLHWQESDPQLLRKINRLLEECSRTPFSGTGKPEPLRGEFSGWWSRRITDEHRLVCRVEGDELWVNQCRYHYSKR